MDQPIGRIETYRMGPWGWTKRGETAKNWAFCDDVPVPVQELYVAEGWTIIFYQPLLDGFLLYPLQEHQAQGEP